MHRAVKRRSVPFGTGLSASYLLLALVLFCACFAFVTLRLHPGSSLTSLPQLSAKTLVVYSYRNIDPEAVSNLQFFLRTVIKPEDSARYVIVVDHGLDKYGHFSSTALPELPANAEYLSIRGCYELGNVGKILSGLSKVQVDINQYQYFLWLDSSVRGPFLPSYLTKMKNSPLWHTLLTSRLTDTIKLVGATISCSPVSLLEDASMLVLPHVESTIMATDLAGLKVIQDAGCFDCYDTWRKAKVKGEITASAAILQAGYNLDCLMLRYEGVDWQDRSKWRCGAMIAPHQEGTYDGTSLNPLEVMFVKVKHGPTMQPDSVAYQAVKYTEWQTENKASGAQDISKNDWKTHAYKHMQGKVKLKDFKCFDADYYINSAPWEFEGMSAQKAFKHFLEFGFQEGRAYHFTC